SGRAALDDLLEPDRPGGARARASRHGRRLDELSPPLLRRKSLPRPLPRSEAHLGRRVVAVVLRGAHHRAREPEGDPPAPAPARAPARTRAAGGVLRDVSLLGVASYLPPREVDNDFFAPGAATRRGMFTAPKTRRHVAKDETAAHMIHRAAGTLM